MLIDNEMNQTMTRRWLRRQGIRNTEAVVDVINLRGLSSSMFDIGNDAIRARWSRRLSDLGADFVLFDCLAPALDALGLDPNREAGKFLVPFDELLTEAGCADALIAHHMGHSTERARGDSRIVGWSDGNWKIVLKDDDRTGSRFFSAVVRDADPVPEGELTFDPQTLHLTYAAVSRKESRDHEAVREKMRAIAEVLAEALEDNPDDPWMNTTAIRGAVGGRSSTVAARSLSASPDRSRCGIDGKPAARPSTGSASRPTIRSSNRPAPAL